MALEQMRAFLAGQAQATLGETTILGPDHFPLLLTSDLRPEHETISELINTAGAIRHGSEIRDDATLQRMREADTQQRTRYCLALIERAFAYDAKLVRRDNCAHANFFDSGPVAEAISILFNHGVDVVKVVPPLLEWFTAYRFNYYATPAVERALDWIQQTYSASNLPDQLRHLLIALRGQFSDVDYRPAQIAMALENRTDLLKYPEDQWLESSIDKLIGKGPWLVLVPCEVWASEALRHLDAVPPEERENWFKLLTYCHSATSSKPSAKWLKKGFALSDAIPSESFAAHLISWFVRSNEGRVRPTLCLAAESVDERQRMHEVNAAVLRGLLWLSPTVARPELIQAIARVCFSAYRKIPGTGSRALKVGNAGVYALGQINHPLALGQIALLKTRVDLASAHRAIERAFTLLAERSNLSREELDEMSVPTYGLTAVGVGEEKMGEFTARLNITGTHSTELTWLDSDGKPQHGMPAEFRRAHGEQLKELQASLRDIHRTLPAQRDRIESLFLQDRSWPINVWRERYLDHPLVGALARRIIWEFTDNDRTLAGIWHDGQIVDVDLKAISVENPSITVRLWHPIAKDAAEIAAWRAWLEAQQLQQPFKQAHREVYLLTEAERRASTHSNRFAAHVLKQHQFHALCGVRGWKDQLRLMNDAEYPPPSLKLPQWGLRAEFSVEGIGRDYGADGADTTESGVYLRVATREVRFQRIDAAPASAPGDTNQRAVAEPVPLEEIPPLVFSEVMRDVDLFVAGASIGNDPTWSDGGPQGRHRNYWQRFSFGELGATATTRKEVLQRLVPRLKIADACTFDDRFLVVKGSLRTYKIHLGSSNILMQPNDQYLCLVPAPGDTHDFPVLLPFEGDRTLTVILTKAFLLANDTKITDPAILSQVKAA